ncbi:hypothetical protein K438DRAFT_1952872 [Mycena galopus ATCC 62051]|nr:hypothetical protein K438DRAFT_1952872 [Mycena galopus ATCC 62051]
MTTVPPTPTVPVPQFDTTLGALLVGGLVATALYGITVLQTFAFFAGGTTDRASHKALVAFLFILDTFDTFLNGHILYFYLVTNYLAPQAIATPVWSLIIHVATTSLSNFVVRSAFTRRVYRLSNGNIPTTFWIVSLSILDLACGLIITVKGFPMKTFFELDGLASFMYLNFAAGTLSDLSVTLALCYLLRGSRTGFPRFGNLTRITATIPTISLRTDSLIGVLIMYAVNTGLVVALDASASMIAFIFMHDNFIFLAFYLLLSKLYLNSFLAILNARRGLREELDDPQTIHLSQIHCTTQWRSGVGHDPEGQRSHSSPRVVGSKSDSTNTILQISLDANPVIEKGMDFVESPHIARVY